LLRKLGFSHRKQQSIKRCLRRSVQEKYETCESANDRVTVNQYTPLPFSLTERNFPAMNMTQPDAPAVWVLVFDRKPTDCEFDRLDLEATCFEQFLLQDVRSKVGPLEVFGGEPAFSKLANAMTALNQNAYLVTISTDAQNAFVITHEDDQGIESSLRRSLMTLLSASHRNLNESSETETNSRKSAAQDTAFSANLVWIEARISISTQPATAATLILDSVYDRLSSYSKTEKKCPVLIVTFRSGDDFIVSEPLECGISEESIHVPLWIRPNSGHACRVQTLAGSFDLMPSIATFLGSAEATDEVRPPDVAQIADLSDREVVATILTSEPQSLAFLCGAPQACADRVLKLQGDGWKAARSTEFLLVISDTSASKAGITESDGDNSEELSRRLYVKPEDRFNVNDVSGTYADVTEELTAMIRRIDRIETTTG
jgi:hypothetical protein